MGKIPKYVIENSGLSSAREFKARKRAEIIAVQRAIDQLRRGCAFLPGGVDLCDAASEAMKQLRDNCRADRWGR